jgi:hypothetical protein
VALSFIVGGNQSTRRKPTTCRKSLTNFITYCCIEYILPWAGFKLATLVMIGTDCIGNCKSNYHTICQWLATGCWFSPGTLVSSNNKTKCHKITEILLKVVLYTITLTLICSYHFQVTSISYCSPVQTDNFSLDHSSHLFPKSIPVLYQHCHWIIFPNLMFRANFFSSGIGHSQHSCHLPNFFYFVYISSIVHLL